VAERAFVFTRTLIPVTVAPTIGNPVEASVTTPAIVMREAATGADGTLNVAVFETLDDLPPSSEYPTARPMDVMAAPDESLILIVPDGTDPPAAIRRGDVGFASATPAPRVKRMVVIVAAALPLVSFMVNDVR